MARARCVFAPWAGAAALAYSTNQGITECCINLIAKEGLFSGSCFGLAFGVCACDASSSPLPLQSPEKVCSVFSVPFRNPKGYVIVRFISLRRRALFRGRDSAWLSACVLVMRLVPHVLAISRKSVPISVRPPLQSLGCWLARRSVLRRTLPPTKGSTMWCKEAGRVHAMFHCLYQSRFIDFWLGGDVAHGV